MRRLLIAVLLLAGFAVAADRKQAIERERPARPPQVKPTPDMMPPTAGEIARGLTEKPGAPFNVRGWQIVPGMPEISSSGSASTLFIYRNIRARKNGEDKGYGASVMFGTAADENIFQVFVYSHPKSMMMGTAR